MWTKIINSYFKLLDEKIESWTIVVIIIAILIILTSVIINNTGKNINYSKSNIELNWK